MRFTIRHETLYCYSAQVSFAPHVTRLRPRDDGTQRTVAFALEIEPVPSHTAQALDADGNIIDHHWFLATADRLRIASTIEVETLRSNAFDYIPDVSFDTLPVRYVDGQARALAPYLTRAELDGNVLAFAEAIAADTGSRPVAFLDGLNRAISQRIRNQIRYHGRAQPAAVTLTSGTGACRDLTVLYMEAARALGFAARFVSGYRRGNLGMRRHLHAWAEVYIPGGGWRGWDPVEGVAIADTHVALAASAVQAGTMPVEGSYYGAGVTTTLSYKIEIGVDSSFDRNELGAPAGHTVA